MKKGIYRINSFIVKGDRVYVFLTQGKKTIIDRADLEKILDYHWFTKKDCNTFYTITHIYNNGKRAILAMHRFLRPDLIEADHVNRDGLDNRKVNLREGKRINQQNRGMRKDNTSKFKGVSWHKRDKKWQADVQVNNSRKFLGYFSTPEEAAEARDEAVQKRHPEGAFLNFPENRK